MLLLAAAIVGAILVSWAAGRRLRATPATGPARALLLLTAGAVCLLVGPHVGRSLLGVVLTDGGYALLLLFAVANRRHPGLILIAVGLLANLAVVAADRGMPVKGLPAGVDQGSTHHGLSTRDHLTFLGDNIRLAGETISPGDITIAAGAALAAFCWLEPSPDDRSRARQPVRRRARSS
jgi:hypothetical protein